MRGFDVFTLYIGQHMRRHTLKEAGHVFQLWDVVWLVAAVLLQQGEDPVVFAAGVGRVEGLQLSEHLPPRGSLLLRVLHPWDWLATGSHDLSVSPVPCAGVTLVLPGLTQHCFCVLFLSFKKQKSVQFPMYLSLYNKLKVPKSLLKNIIIYT